MLAVGGTHFTSALDAQGDYTGEKAWGSGIAGSSGSGGGLSPYESQPAYQRGVVTQSTTARTFPDVAFDANTGVAVYDSADNPWNPWVTIGGTSLATPCWAALVAIADQGLVALGRGTLGDQSAMTMLYALQTTGGARSLPRHRHGQQRLSRRAGLRPRHGPRHADGPGRSPRGSAATPRRPVAAGPSGAVYNTAPTFQWSAVAGAQTYHLVAYDQATSAEALDVVVAVHVVHGGLRDLQPRPLLLLEGRGVGRPLDVRHGVRPARIQPAGGHARPSPPRPPAGPRRARRRRRSPGRRSTGPRLTASRSSTRPIPRRRS